ncbi:hypothetical protein K432DRAFT_386534 [Lepidopterella palustris CBS 459.81]|uniref:Uncharacterized protein n=1 Tax=Lepidopterella palustris CBS 459.81 TaxID=1314670 RepID=A0A8E2E0C4_9PEZI|nr:hypothetical protein K432DRAFT_386534 [Lepidopterella palustris CBS 459.81]
MVAHEISTQIADDNEKLKSKASETFGSEFNDAHTEVDPKWTYYYTDMVPSHTKDRIVIFRAQPPSKQLGCVRVRDKHDITKTIWDSVGKEGIYMGDVPAGCPFEAMLVEVKLITPK